LAALGIKRIKLRRDVEASHRDLLHAGWNVERVNHPEIYSDHGKHTNMVES